MILFHVFYFTHYMELGNAFTRCLKELGCFGGFVKNFNKLPRYYYSFNTEEKCIISFASFVKHHKMQLSKNCSIRCFADMVNYAFDWSETKEGRNFWYNIYNILLVHETFLKNEHDSRISFYEHVAINTAIINIMREYFKDK